MKQQHLMQDEDVESRLSRTEAVIESLAHDVGELTSTVNTLRSTVQSFMERSGRTNWPAIGGACTVMLMVVGMLGSGYVRDVGRLEEQEKLVVGYDRERQFDRGRMEEKVIALERVTTKLDTDLQREMRTLDAATLDKINTLDHRLQAEFNDKIDRSRTDIQILQEGRTRMLEIDARQTEAIEALKGK